MSMLRERFTREIQLLNLAPRTVDNYISVISKLTKFTGKSPLCLVRDDIAAFLHHELTVEKLAPATINLQIGAFKTFYKLMSPKSDAMKDIQSMKVPETLPVVLTEAETVLMLRAAASMNAARSQKFDIVIPRKYDRKDKNAGKLLTIPVTSFISRFLLHAVPSGFVRICYYGFLANRNRTENRARCRAAVTGNQEPMKDEEMVTQIELSLQDLTVTFPVCPHCRGTHLTLTKEIPKRQNEMHRHIA